MLACPSSNALAARVLAKSRDDFTVLDLLYPNIFAPLATVSVDPNWLSVVSSLINGSYKEKIDIIEIGGMVFRFKNGKLIG